MAWPPVLSSGIRAGIRQVPVSEFLPGGYVAGTTDIGPAVQAAADAIETDLRGELLLPPGTHLWNSPVYLDVAVREFSYRITGNGKGTTIKLGSGLDGEYAIHNNENAAGTIGISSTGFPRLTLEYLTVDGQSGTRGMVFSNASSVACRHMKVLSTYRLVQTTGYCDQMEFRHLRIQPGSISGAVMYYNHGNGDGLVMEQIGAGDDVVVADVQNCNGGTITGGIVGVYKFTSCQAISVIGYHNDGGDDVTGYQVSPSFVLSSSKVSFYGGWDQIGTLSPVIQVNDTSSVGYSEVRIYGWNFGFRPHTANKVRFAHVQVLAAQPATKVSFRGCGSDFEPESTTNRYPAGPTFAATDSGIQAAFDAWPTAMLEDADLAQTDLGWQFLSPGGGRIFRRIGTAPSLTASAVSNVPGSFSAGTKFYKVAVYTDKTRALATTASTEASVAISGTQSAQLAVTTRATPALVRIWRGTAAGTYTAYADLAISGYAAAVIDTGLAVNGIAWTSTGIPTPPAANTTMDGTVTGRAATFAAGAAPTAGTWAAGDRVTATAPAAGGSEGWVCVTAGTPGTWKTFGSIAP